MVHRYQGKPSTSADVVVMVTVVTVVVVMKRSPPLPSSLSLPPFSLPFDEYFSNTDDGGGSGDRQVNDKSTGKRFRWTDLLAPQLFFVVFAQTRLLLPLPLQPLPAVYCNWKGKERKER